MKKNKVDELIYESVKPYAKDYARVLKLIKKFDRICVFRHVKPDYDAIGSQLGLATWIKDNFPNKDVKCVGSNHVRFTPQCFPYMDEVDDSWFEEPHLAIVVDTADKSRISDDRYKKATRLVKIDHHPNIKPYGRIRIVNEDSPAAGQMIAEFVLTQKGTYLSRDAARWIYIALAGDSSRFKYSTTTPASYAVAKELLKTGFDVGEVHRKMYTKSANSLEFMKFVLNNYKVSPKGVAYYVLSNDDLLKFGLKAEQGKEQISLFDGLEGIHIWCSISEDIEEKKWRVSIRSSKIAINEVAEKYRGGGHANASGAKLKSLSELDSMIADLDNLIL